MDSGNINGRTMQSSDDDDDEDECYDQSSSSSMAHESFLPPTSAFFLINPSMSNPHDLLSQHYSLFPSTYNHDGLRVVSPSIHAEPDLVHFDTLQPGSHHSATSFTTFGDFHAPGTLSSGGLDAAAVGGPNPGSDLSRYKSQAQGDQMDTVIVRNNPKKRARASRRAPTTVLTTDTMNFRSMVQEFTGIPEPPFSGSSSFPRRLDLFLGSGSGLRLGGHLEATGAMSRCPIRPSPQKIPSVASLTSPTSPSALQTNTGIRSSGEACGTTNKSSATQKVVPHPTLDFQSFLQSHQNMEIPSAFAEVATGDNTPKASSGAGGSPPAAQPAEHRPEWHQH